MCATKRGCVGHGDDEEGAQVSSLNGTNGLVIHGRDRWDFSGISVSSGDVNGDGYADVLIGAPAAAGSSNSALATGETYVVFGKASGWAASMSVGNGFCCTVCSRACGWSLLANVRDQGGCGGHSDDDVRARR